MKDEILIDATGTAAGQQPISRRAFSQILGAGLLVSASQHDAEAQRRGGGAPRSMPISARVHIGADGAITVMTGKVEVGQGSRAEITQAAAEELRVAPEAIALIMADTDLVPDDGITAGSRTTPSTLPAVRQGCAAAREALAGLAAKQWGVPANELEVANAIISHSGTGRKLSYGDLANAGGVEGAFGQSIPENVALRAVETWEVMGMPFRRPNVRDIVTGAHRFTSDIVRPGMLYGKVLRAPAYNARLVSVDLGPAEAMPGVFAVHEGDFAGCAAPTSYQAAQAVRALEATAKWDLGGHPPSSELYKFLKDNARGGGNPVSGAHTVSATYEIAYIQHAPMEPRAAVAEWEDGKLTVWTGSQAPTRVHGELTDAFKLPRERVRVIIPDTGGGFGGKHSGEAAVEAARLARAAGKPVCLRWTRTEEFTWAYFRPAAVIEAHAALDGAGKLTGWDFTNINAGGSGIDTPYEIPGARSHSVNSNPPLKQGSYRALASTGNNFARECFMDELAAVAGQDPLAFRLAHLEHPRLRPVLEEAAKRFGWEQRKQRAGKDTGVGLACGTEKGSYVAACAEIRIDRARGIIHVDHVCEVFECGAVVNPENLRTQILSCIIMGLGGALHEEMIFDEGKIRNGAFSKYRVPRFKDVPELDIHVLDRPDLESAGAGETPIIAIAPAIGNAVFQATGVRIRSLPIRGEALKMA